MENASQALLIAAGVLIGVMILSLGIYLFNVLGRYAANTQNEIDKIEIAQFNDQFLKYSGLTELTMQDIITVKNYALESNKKYGNYNPLKDRAAENNDYIDVYYAETKSQVQTASALIFNNKDEDLLTAEMEKIKEGEEVKRFTCEVVVNSSTGRVNNIYFYPTK